MVLRQVSSLTSTAVESGGRRESGAGGFKWNYTPLKARVRVCATSGSEQASVPIGVQRRPSEIRRRVASYLT